MLKKISIIGEYLADGRIAIGGKEFRKGLLLPAEVDEPTFKSLKVAEENGWFKLKSDNYAEFLASRGITPVAAITTVTTESFDKELADKELADKDPVEGEPVEGDPVEGEPVEGEPVEGEPVEGEPVEGKEVTNEEKEPRKSRKSRKTQDLDN